MNPVHILAWMTLAAMGVIFILVLMWVISVCIQGMRLQKERERCSRIPLAKGQLWIQDPGTKMECEWNIEQFARGGFYATSNGIIGRISMHVTQEQWNQRCENRVMILLDKGEGQ